MKILVPIIIALASSVHAGSQQSAKIEWIQSDDQFYMAQRTADARLLLTPNESFFPKLGLAAEGEGEEPDVELQLNGGSSYKAITQWDPGDVAEWGLWFETTGSATVRVLMANAGKEGRYTLSLGDQKKTFSATEAAPLKFAIKKPGRCLLRLACENESESSATQLHAIELTGPATKNAAVLRKRWRPAAAHAKFTNSHDPEGVRLCIIEMDAKPGTLGFYAPITTPFGYYGPTWTAEGLANTGFNFSLWSFGRGSDEPPVEQLSHLIAIGDPEAKFSGFSHEGTGVKIRDWEPLAGRQGQRQAFAIRMEPGEKYTTYFTYFYAQDEGRWRLFGVGKTYNKRNPKPTLGIGSFVEVPGAAAKQRTGPYERQMRYRGWVVDGKGKLHPYDRMGNGNVDKTTGLTHTDRGVTEDGWFYLQTGGWAFQKKGGTEDVVLPGKIAHRVDYLDADDLKYLQTVPCEITGTGIKLSASGANVSFNIRNLGKNPEVKIYWGTEEGLTFSDRWKNSTDVKNPREGANTITLDAPRGKPLFVRLFLKNLEGQFWSMDTLAAVPAE